MQPVRALILVVLSFLTMAVSSAAAMIAGADGRLYFWGQDSINAPTTDKLTTQRTAIFESGYFCGYFAKM